MTAELATHLLHRLTSYEPGREWTDAINDERLVHGFQPNDFDHLPRWHKAYPAELPRHALPREWQPVPALATDVLAGTAKVATVELDLPALARLLFLSAGVTRTSERRGKQVLFRAAGSAGARFPLELYIAVPDDGALPAGVHWYDPSEHALVEIGPPPRGGAPSVVITGVPWRTGWRYRERGFRHIYWDAGTMLAQFLALADSAGIPADLYTRFPDQRVAELVGSDRHHEFPVAVMALGGEGPALGASGPAMRGELDANGVEFPLVTHAQHAGDCDALGTPLPRGAAVPAAQNRTGDTLDDLVLRRGSTRLMDPGASLPQAVLNSAISAAMRGVNVPHWVVVHAVDGMAPGLYRWPDLGTLVRGGNLREELFRVALDQGLARDASFVVISAVDLTRLDDRSYREAQLSAGLVEGRLHLMAYALGFGASGMTFQDSDIPALLGADLACLLWTCVGVPEYRSRKGGMPGRPAAITGVHAPR